MTQENWQTNQSNSPDPSKALYYDWELVKFVKKIQITNYS